MSRMFTVLVAIVVLLAAGCVTQPGPERSGRSTAVAPDRGDSGGQSPSENPATVARPVEIPPVSAYPDIADRIAPSLPARAHVARSGDDVTLVAGNLDSDDTVDLLGLARRDSEIILWTGTISSNDAVTVDRVESVGRATEIRDFTPLALSSSGPRGFSAMLVDAASEIRVVSLFVSGRPYIVAVPQSATQITEVRDIDNDGVLELLQYSLVFEAPSNREVVLDIFEWSKDSFVLSSSVPILRLVNRFLDSIELALRDQQDDVLSQLVERAVAVEGPPLETLLPASIVTVPRLQEVPVDISRRPWEFSYEFLVGNEEVSGVYRIVIVVPPNPAEEAVRIKG